jgi:hypothetical protein
MALSGFHCTRKAAISRIASCSASCNSAARQPSWAGRIGIGRVHPAHFAAINGMMLDMLAAVARKDCDDRRRQAFFPIF